MNITDKEINQTLESDIVVIGAGGSGLAAAVTAADKGAKVIVIEKRSKPGGNTVFAHGMFAAESPVQKRMHVDAKRDEFFKLKMEYSHWSLDARIVRAFVDKSGDTIRWLEEKGVVFNVAPFFYGQTVPVFHFIKGWGTAIIKALIKDCESLGLQILYDTRAMKLLTDESGRVVGVVSETKDKKAVVIKAKSVIIATGGYGSSRELLEKYYPNYEQLIIRGLPHDLTGDGISMAFEAGAAEEGLGHLHLSGPYNKTFGFSLNALPENVWVNKEGKRFMDESVSIIFFEAVSGVIRQPDQVCFSIFDEAMKQNVLKNGYWKGEGLYFPGVAELEKELQDGIKANNVKISNSWAQIAEWIGTDPENLAASVEEYNVFCDQGHDDLFAKDSKYLQPLRTPPYYAVQCAASLLTTIGGIKINHRMEVIDKRFKPIKGLYAVGNDTGGWSSDTYNARVTGTTAAFAINSGRIAGENAARDI